MALQEYINSLPGDKQLQIAVSLAKMTLPIWHNYADRNELIYQDSVVGMKHLVDRNLLKKAVATVEDHVHRKKAGHELLDVQRQFHEPIVALQDKDWELPGPVQNTFYAIFNLVETCAGKLKTTFGDLTVYVSINQAIDALESSGHLTIDEIKTVIYVK